LAAESLRIGSSWHAIFRLLEDLKWSLHVSAENIVLAWANLFEILVVGFVAGQNATPAAPPQASAQSAPIVPAPIVPAPSVAFNVLVDSAIRQEHRLIVLMRNFKPIVETYIQQYPGKSPKGDDYFLSRLDLTGNAPVTVAFADRSA